MTKRFVLKTTLLAVLDLLMALFSLIMLFFSARTPLYGITLPSENAFDWLTRSSPYIHDPVYQNCFFFLAFVGVFFAIFMICKAIEDLVKGSVSNHGLIAIGVAVSITLYATIGIILALQSEERFTTSAYWSLPIFFVLYVTYVYVKRFLPEQPINKTVCAAKKEETENIALSETESIKLLMKYKDLLDQGIITQEEFEKKKKDLLGM